MKPILASRLERFCETSDKRFLPPLREKLQQKAIVQQQDSQRQNQVVKKGVVGGEDHAHFPRSHNKKANDTPTSRQKHRPNQSQLQRESGKHTRRMEPVRQMLRVPA